MEHKIGVLSKILDFPYAIFKSGTCVWKTDVDNTAIFKKSFTDWLLQEKRYLISKP